jgi:hypothetical protein
VRQLGQQVVAGAALVEGTGDRRRGEPDRRRGTAGLHVGRQREQPRQLGVGTPGHDPREVALEEHLVHLGRERGAQALGEHHPRHVARAVRAGARGGTGQHGPRRGQRARPGDAQQRGLAEQPRDGGLRRHRPWGAPPQHLDHVPDTQRGARLRVQDVEHRGPQPGDPGAVQVGGQRRPHGALLVARPHLPGGPARRRPGEREAGPPVRVVALLPAVRVRGRHVRGGGVAVVRDEPRGGGHLDHDRGRRLVRLQVEREAPQVADRQPAGPQGARRVGVPGGHQAGDEPHGLQRGAGRLGVDRGRGDRAARRSRRDELRVAVRAPGTQGEAHVPRQQDVAGVGAQQQPGVHEPVDRRARRGAGRRDDADGRTPRQGVQDLLLGSGGPRQVEVRGRAVGRAGGAETCRVGPEHLLQAGGRVQPVAVVPHQARRSGDLEHAAHGVGRVRGPEGGGEVVGCHRRPVGGQRHDRLEHGEGAGVQVGDGALGAGAARGARGQGAQRRRGGGAEVGASREQGDELVVAALPHPLGIGTGHLIDATRPRWLLRANRAPAGQPAVARHTSAQGVGMMPNRSRAAVSSST